MSMAKRLALLLTGLMLSGCGLFVPKPHEFYEAKSSDSQFQNVVINNVKCELHRAAQQILRVSPSPLTEWVRKWGAKVDLTFQVDEETDVNPGAAFDPPGIFSWGVGLGGSAHATRTEEFAVTYAFVDLIGEGDVPDSCVNEDGILIQSDLDIKDFFVKHVLLTTNTDTLPTDPSKDNQFYDTLNYTTAFTATYNANITPTWTFTHVKVNPSGNLLATSRKKTTTLLITFSEASPAAAGKKAQLSPEGIATYNALLTGKAIGLIPSLQR